MISICRLPSQNSVFFLNSLTKIIDVFADKYDNYLIMGDFKLESGNTVLTNSLDSNNLTNLIKTNTCFKSKGLSTDLILTNMNYSFTNTSSYETGRSDHHHIIYTTLKFPFVNIEPKQLDCRDFKNILFEGFREDLSAFK